MIGLAVVVIVNGSIVASVPPARLIAGRVMAPVRVMSTFAERTAIGDDGTIVVVAGAHRCTLRLGATTATCDDRAPAFVQPPFAADGETYVPLAAIAEALGGSVAYDGHSRSLAVHFDVQRTIRTPAPYDPGAPRVLPTTLFTPEPRPATPRPLESGVPRPRRTAIPETPSQFPGV